MNPQIDRYKVVIWWSEEDGRFLAQMPDLNDVMGDGPTQADALAMVREVAEIWLKVCAEDGREIPQPEEIKWPADGPALTRAA